MSDNLLDPMRESCFDADGSCKGACGGPCTPPVKATPIPRTLDLSISEADGHTLLKFWFTGEEAKALACRLSPSNAREVAARLIESAAFNERKISADASILSMIRKEAAA